MERGLLRGGFPLLALVFFPALSGPQRPADQDFHPLMQCLKILGPSSTLPIKLSNAVSPWGRRLIKYRACVCVWACFFEGLFLHIHQSILAPK